LEYLLERKQRGISGKGVSLDLNASGKMSKSKGIFVRSEHERLGSVDTMQTVHQDGSIDFVDKTALGGALNQMPDGYFRSVQFGGVVVVSLYISSW
jgi:hypothetical protein